MNDVSVAFAKLVGIHRAVQAVQMLAQETGND